MDVKKEAKHFAIMAHNGQVRKSEKEKPMVIHPILVGNLVESWGFDDNVVAASFLHDVVEDTTYTLSDIEHIFGTDIAYLVMCASESDKKMSWEDRKKETIAKVRTLNIRAKAIICADKINNMESLINKFAREGKRDFSAFKRGEEDQKWYYTEIYNSLIEGERIELPMFQRYKESLDKLFYTKEDYFLKDMFRGYPELLNRLLMIDAEKKELLELKSLCSNLKPFVVEFLGTPRSGKTSTIISLEEFFKKGGFKTQVIEEFTTSKYYKEDFALKIKDLNPEDRDILIVEEVAKILEREANTDSDIILIDRSINDRQIWNYRRCVRKELPQDRYLVAKEKYSDKSKSLIDALIMFYTSAPTSLRRDYLSSLALEPRSFLSVNNIEEYNDILKNLRLFLSSSVKDSMWIDTTYYKSDEARVEVAEKLLPMIRKRYLKNINDTYGRRE